MIDVIHVRPGDPGFDELAAKVTPLERIRKGYSEDTNRLSADIVISVLARRNETVDGVRG